MDASWYNAANVTRPGSVILARELPALSRANALRRQRIGIAEPKALTTSMSPKDLADWLDGIAAQNRTRVDERSAMAISAIYACVTLIGGAIASLPLKFYRLDDAGNRAEYKPDEWWLLNEQPFTCWSAATAWEYAAWSLLLQADSFWRIHRASRLSTRIAGFEPLHPRTVEPRRLGDRLIYIVSPQPAVGSGGATTTIDQDDMLHVAGPGFDGLRGQSQIQYALATSGSIALSADDYSASFFRNGMRPDYALQTDSSLSTEQINDLRTQVAERHQGPRNAFRPMVLQGGLKIAPITLNAVDSQIIEQRRFQVEDIARIFGVPPFMIGHTDKTTSWGSGVEQMSIAFVKYTLQRHLVKFEQEINRKVFRIAGRFCEFQTAGLERGDIKTRFEAYRIALGRAGEQPWMTTDEVRRAENLPPGANLQSNQTQGPTQ